MGLDENVGAVLKKKLICMMLHALHLVLVHGCNNSTCVFQTGVSTSSLHSPES